MRHPRSDLTGEETQARILDADLVRFVEDAALRVLDVVLPDRGYPAGRESHRERFRRELRRQLTGNPARDASTTMTAEVSPAWGLPRPAEGVPASPPPPLSPRTRRAPRPEVIWGDDDAEHLEAEIEELLTSLDEEAERKQRASGSAGGVSRAAGAGTDSARVRRKEGRAVDLRAKREDGSGPDPSGDCEEGTDPPTLPAPCEADLRDPPTLPTPSDAPTLASDTVRVLREYFRVHRLRTAKRPRMQASEQEGRGRNRSRKRMLGMMHRVYDYVLPPPEDDGAARPRT